MIRHCTAVFVILSHWGIGLEYNLGHLGIGQEDKKRQMRISWTIMYHLTDTREHIDNNWREVYKFGSEHQ